MKIQLNTILLIGILGLVLWYLFFKPIPVQAAPGQKTQAPAPANPVTTVIQKITEVIWKDRPVMVAPAIKNQSAIRNQAISDFSNNSNMWRERPWAK